MDFSGHLMVYALKMYIYKLSTIGYRVEWGYIGICIGENLY